MEQQKNKITQDYLLSYLKQHHFIITILADRMGVSEAIVRNSLNRTANRHGKPMKLSAANLQRLNQALPQIAQELHACLIATEGRERHVSPKGTVYYPGCMPDIKRLNQYLKLQGVTRDVLGWGTERWRMRLSVERSNIYGYITADEIARLNTEISSVAGSLERFEVVADREE